MGSAAQQFEFDPSQLQAIPLPKAQSMEFDLSDLKPSFGFTGAETGMPSVAKPPLPLALQPPVTSIQSDTPTYQNPRTGVRYARQQPGVEGGPLSVLDAPLVGAGEVASGVEQAAQPGLKAKAEGAAQVIGGTLKAATPLMAGEAVVSPIISAIALGTGTLSQEATHSLLKKLDVPEEYNDLASSLAGLAGGAAGVKLTGLPGMLREAAFRERVRQILQDKLNREYAARQTMEDMQARAAQPTITDSGAVGPVATAPPATTPPSSDILEGEFEEIPGAPPPKGAAPVTAEFAPEDLKPVTPTQTSGVPAVIEPGKTFDLATGKFTVHDIVNGKVVGTKDSDSGVTPFTMPQAVFQKMVSRAQPVPAPIPTAQPAAQTQEFAPEDLKPITQEAPNVNAQNNGVQQPGEVRPGEGVPPGASAAAPQPASAVRGPAEPGSGAPSAGEPQPTAGDQGGDRAGSVSGVAPETEDRVTGTINPPVTEEGLKAAEETDAKKVSDIKEIETTPQDRGVQTAEAVAAKGATVTPNPAFGPWNLGELQGQRQSEVEPQILDYMTKTPDKAVPGGTSYDDFKNPLIGEVQKQVAEWKPGEKRLNVTHSIGIHTVGAWANAGAPENKDISAAYMQNRPKMDGGALWRLDPRNMKLTPAKNDSADGIYFLRHQETALDNIPAGGGGPISRAESLKPEVATTLKEGATRMNPDGGVQELKRVPLDQVHPMTIRPSSIPEDVWAARGGKNTMYPERVEQYRNAPSPIAPELIREGNSYAIWDGHHRVEAARQNGAKDILAWVPQEAESNRKVSGKETETEPVHEYSSTGQEIADKSVEAEEVPDTEEEEGEEKPRGLTEQKKGERGAVSFPNIRSVLRGSGSAAAAQKQATGARTDAVNALRSTLEEESDKDTGERIRTLAVGERDARIAETNQAREELADMLPDHVDREALTLYRDFKSRPGELRQFLNGTHPMYDDLSPEAQKAAIEKVQKLEPAILSALSPSEEMLGADEALTHYFTEHLREGRELGFLDSKIPNDEYITHLLQPSMEQPSKLQQLLRGKFGPKKFKFAKQRFYPTMLHAVVGGAKIRTLDALDALGVYGEKYATTAAYHHLVDVLKDTGAGKWGSYKQQQDGKIPATWVELSPESRIFRHEIPFLTEEGEAAIAHQSLFVPPEVEEAMRPILDPNYMTRVPGFQQSRAYQAYIKAVELGLSFFHVKALELSALNNMGPGGMLQTAIADMKSPEFLDAEKAWTRAGLTTPILDRTAEVYMHMRPSSLPTLSEKIRGLPVLKQLDQAAAAISHFTFGIVQRKNKVVDASLKFAGWLAKHPNATPEQQFTAQRMIAKEINAVYGGLNWEIMGHNRVTRELSKALLLAPDWTFSNVANLKYASEGGPGGNAARMFWLRAAIFGMALTAGLSLLISGKLSKDPTRVMLGKDKEGKDLTDNVFFVGAPGDVSSLVHNVARYGAPVGVARTIAAKLGPIARTGVHMMSNQDAVGKEIIPKKTRNDLFGNKQPGRAHEPTFLEKNALGVKELAKETAPVPFSIGTIVNMVMDQKHHYSAGQYVSALINGRKPVAE